MNHRIACSVGFVLSLVLAVILTQPSVAAPTAATTLDNLNTAFNGESNAAAKYTAFAKKADEEGYGEVASLFRAAARAEGIHAAKHSEVIKKLGGQPKADVKPAEVKSTKENLQAALEGETYERDKMYPPFLDQAKKEAKLDAVETFAYAKTAEAEHAKLYGQYIASLDKVKGSKAKPLYVCTICGYTTVNLDFEKCVSCFNPKDKYVQVS